MDNRRITVTLALIVLICFFLPWVQLSCGASTSRLSGVDLARDGHNSLWLIPLLMLAILFVGIARAWRERRGISAFVIFIGGRISTFLLNLGRLRAADTTNLYLVKITKLVLCRRFF